MIKEMCPVAHDKIYPFETKRASEKSIKNTIKRRKTPR